MNTDRALHDEKEANYAEDSDTRSYLSDSSGPTFNKGQHDYYKDAAGVVTKTCWKDDLTLSPPTPGREKLSDAITFFRASKKSSDCQLPGSGPGFHKSPTVLLECREQEFMKQCHTAPRNSLRSSRTLHGLKFVSDIHPIETDTSNSDDAQTRCSDATTLN